MTIRSTRQTAMLAALAGVVAAGAHNTVATSQTPTRRRTSPRTIEKQRYRGMTAEQRAWNEAVDAKRAAKNARA